MNRFSTVDEVLDFAIHDEEESARLYGELARRMDNARMRTVFEEFAREERAHKARLVDVRKGKVLLQDGARVQDLHIAEQLGDVPPTEDLDYQQALILAMKAEKAAFRLYTELAQAAREEPVRRLLEGLAREEANHKLRFELEYESHYLDENQDWKAREEILLGRGPRSNEAR